MLPRRNVSLRAMLTWLLSRLYPSSFRRDFGAEWTRFVQEQRQEPRYRRPVLGSVLYWIDVTRDAVTSGFRMRWSDGAFSGAKRGADMPELDRLARYNGYMARKTELRSVVATICEGLLQDLRLALRSLRRNPIFTAVAVLTLAIGIGANTAVLSVVDAVLVRPLPYAEPDRVVMLYETRPLPDGMKVYIAPAIFFDWQERATTFADMAYLEASTASLTGGEEPRLAPSQNVGANFFSVLGVHAILGRLFLPGDDLPGSSPVVVISHALWQETFHGDPGVVGATVSVDDRSHTIVGVTPTDFTLNSVFTGGTPDLWVTPPVSPELRADRSHGGRFFLAVARLRSGVTLEQAQAEMDGVAAALAADYPRSNLAPGQAWGALVTNIHQDSVRLARPFILFAMAMAGLVLLIACINVANLLLARSATRQREIAVRTSLGAGRWRMVRQLLTESALLSALGGAAGLLLARVVGAGLVAWGPHPTGGQFGGSSIPLLSRVALDERALLATLLLCVVATVVFGVGPALGATGRDPLQGLRSAEFSAGWRRRYFDRNVFVAVEVALALVLVIGTGLLGSTFVRLYDVPLGFRPDGAEAMSVELSRTRYLAGSGAMGTDRAAWTVRPARGEFVQRMVQEVARLPGVGDVGAIDILPLRPHPWNHGGLVNVEGAEPHEYEIAGIPMTKDESGNPHNALWRTVTPGYFDAMQIPLMAGRDFSWSDDAEAPGVIIVDQNLADWYWPRVGALGKRLQARVGREWRSLEVVGIVGNVDMQRGFNPDEITLEQSEPGLMYFPYAQPSSEYGPFSASFLPRVSVVARHGGDGQAVAASMREILRELDPEAPITRLESMDASMARSFADRRFHLLVIGSFTVIAFALALIGIYGVMAFQVGQRVHEIGVRMALGARATGVIRMVVGEGARIAVLGALVGVAGAMGATRLLGSWLYGVSPMEPMVFVVLTTLMLGVAVLACWLPARRAAMVDPVEALRAD